MRTRAAMSTVSWDEFLATGWALLVFWSFSHGIEHEVHSLSKNSLDMHLVIKLLSHFKNELKMFIWESKQGEMRWILHQLNIHFQVCVHGRRLLFHFPTGSNFFLHNASSSAETMNVCMDSKRGNFRMKAQRRSMLLRKENFLFHVVAVEVNYGIRGGCKGC
jgi:hypothetical protein